MRGLLRRKRGRGTTPGRLVRWLASAVTSAVRSVPALETVAAGPLITVLSGCRHVGEDAGRPRPGPARLPDCRARSHRSSASAPGSDLREALSYVKSGALFPGLCVADERGQSTQQSRVSPPPTREPPNESDVTAQTKDHSDSDSSQIAAEPASLAAERSWKQKRRALAGIEQRRARVPPPYSFRRQMLSRRPAFWVCAAALFLLFFAVAAPSPLYHVDQLKWHFSATTLTAVFAAYALTLLVTSRCCSSAPCRTIWTVDA
jgi:hypothetical protein